MAKVIENTSIAKHNAEALIFGDLEDFTEKELQELEARYPGIVEARKAIEWPELVLDAMNNIDGEKSSNVLPQHFGPEGSEELVLFVNISHAGKPRYDGVREAVKKICAKRTKIGVKHLAMGRLGCRADGLNFFGLEPVVASADGGKLMIDVYRGEPS